MLKRTIKYEDYNGEQREENFFFSLNKAELLRMNMSKRGGMATYLQNLAEEKDPEKITKIFEEMILTAYGVKSDDGTRFVKSPEVVADFKNSAAYSELFYELATDTDKFIDFVIGIVPADMADEIRKNGGIEAAKKQAIALDAPK